MYQLLIDDYGLHLVEEYETMEEAEDNFDNMAYELPSAVLVIVDSNGIIIKTL